MDKGRDSRQSPILTRDGLSVPVGAGEVAGEEESGKGSGSVSVEVEKPDSCFVNPEDDETSVSFPFGFSEQREQGKKVIATITPAL